MHTRNQHLHRWIAVGLAAAAVAASAAQASGPDDRAGTRGPGAFGSAQLSTTIRPDDRAGARGTGTFESTQPSPRIRPDDRAGARGGGAFSTVVVDSVSTGFDWGDAAIGAAFGLALALLGIGAIMIAHPRNTPELG